MDLGAPISYLVLEKGAPVYDSRGEEVGKVEHVLAAQDADIFDGIVIDARPGPGGWRFADAEQIEGLYERGVVLSVPADALHDPEPGPGELRVNPADAEEEGTLRARLRRAWDYISGNY
ncbi:MAG: hypothetical protein QOJ97_2106 [Solirubrobacteraceae bacterium]|nr:hypothetical protein [Solirubrobacteraceae bacterium]